MNIQIPIIGQQTRAGFVPQDNQSPILVDDERGAALQGFARSLGDLASGVAAWQKGSAQSMPQNPPPADNPPMAESLPAAASANPPPAGPAGADGPGLSPETGASPAAYDPKHPNPVARQDYENAKSQACLAVPTLRNTASRLFADTSASLGPGLPGLVPKVLKGFDEAVEQTLQACTTPESRLYVIEYAKTGRRQLAALCLVSEAQAGVALRETRYRESAAAWAGVVKDDLSQLPAALTALHHAAPDLDPAQKEQTRDAVRTTLLQAGFMAAIKQNPLATYQALVRAGGREDGAPDQSPAAPGNAALDPLVKVMTPAEREHYAPLAYAAWHDAQATQREAFKTRAADAAASFKATGTAPNAPTEPEFITHLGEAEGKRQFQQQRIDALTGQAEQAARTLPVPALAQLRDQADPTTPEGAAVHRAIANIETRRRADPIAYALQNGSYGLAPITSFDDPQALQAELGKRRRAASAIGKDYELFATLLTRDEGKLLATTLRGKPAAEQLALLEQFTGGAAASATASATAPDSAADAALIYATLRGLSADAKVPALAAKLRYEEQRQEAAGAGPSSWGGTGKISAPQTLLEGEALLNPPPGTADPAPAQPYPMPPDSETRRAFAGQLGQMENPLAGEPGAEEFVYGGARAAYAALSRRDGDRSGVFNAARWNAAVKLAMGGSGTARELGMMADPAEANSGSSGATQIQDLATLNPQSPTAIDVALRPEEIGQADGDMTAMGQGAAPRVKTPEKLKRFSRPIEYIDALAKSNDEGKSIGLQHAIAEGQSISANDKESGASAEERKTAAAALSEANRASRKWNLSRIELLEMIDAVGGGLQHDEEVELSVRRALSNFVGVLAANTQGIAKTTNITRREIVPKGFSEVYNKAPEAKKTIDSIADDLALKAGGTVAKAEIKSVKRAAEKVDEHFKGDPTKINDLARNTIIVPPDKMKLVEEQLVKMGASVRVFDGKKDMGYSGINTTMPARQGGIMAEIQVNTPAMIYAKERGPVARAILGNRVYEEIAAKVGIPGGKGHEFYEKSRGMDPQSPAAQEIAAQSRAYYDAIRKANGE